VCIRAGVLNTATLSDRESRYLWFSSEPYLFRAEAFSPSVALSTLALARPLRCVCSIVRSRLGGYSSPHRLASRARSPDRRWQARFNSLPDFVVLLQPSSARNTIQTLRWTTYEKPGNA